jgi:hypothetical protein
LYCIALKYLIAKESRQSQRSFSRYNRPFQLIVQGICRHLEYIVLTIVFAPLANLPIGNSIVFAALALLCFIMAENTLEGSKAGFARGAEFFFVM